MSDWSRRGGGGARVLSHHRLVDYHQNWRQRSDLGFGVVREIIAAEHSRGQWMQEEEDPRQLALVVRLIDRDNGSFCNGNQNYGQFVVHTLILDRFQILS
jgi:hypothetical protein